MTTNIQMGISYLIGKVIAEKKPTCLDEVLGPDYNMYDISCGKNLSGMEIALYKDLGKTESKRLGSVGNYYSLNQMVHIIEELIVYDKKNE